MIVLLHLSSIMLQLLTIIAHALGPHQVIQTTKTKQERILFAIFFLSKLSNLAQKMLEIAFSTVHKFQPPPPS